MMEEILKFYRKGSPLYAAYAIRNFPSLYNGARGRFGTWQKAIEACGISYDQVRKVKCWSNEKRWTFPSPLQISTDTIRN